MPQHVYDIPADKAQDLAQAFAHRMERRVANKLFMYGGGSFGHGDMDTCRRRAKESVQTFIDLNQGEHIVEQPTDSAVLEAKEE